MIEKRYRDAVTGEYVTAEYAAEHPDTTVGETAGWTPGHTVHPTANPVDADAEVAADVESGWLDPADPDSA